MTKIMVGVDATEHSKDALAFARDLRDVPAAESARLDLLFVGSRGYGPHRAVPAGSVTQRLLQKAECPVVVLPRR